MPPRDPTARESPRPAPARWPLTQNALTHPHRRLLATLSSAATALGLAAAVALSSSFRGVDPTRLSALPLQVPTVRYGLVVERFAAVEESAASEGQGLTEVLRELGVERRRARRLARLAARRVEGADLAGRNTAVFRGDDGEIRYVMQDVSAHAYVRVDLATDRVHLADRDGVASEYETAALYYGGDVDSMLAYVSFPEELRASVERAVREELPLDEAFGNGILRLVYTVKRDERGEVLGYGDVEAIRYHVGGEARTAIRFADADLNVDGFFRPDGTPVVRTWLESPVQAGWLSSRYNLRRRHPVLKSVRPHYGTDYAAAYGTPILAMSDGVVVARQWTQHNGNFVKLRHDDRYQTQYLHMKAFAPGIRPGVAVEKGEVIGYVGSTGLASGPHVCLRFWKDGRQVDHLSLDLPNADGLDAEAMAAFEARSERLVGALGDRA